MLQTKLQEKIKERFQITDELSIALFDSGIVNESAVKRLLIREEFNEKSSAYPRTELKEILASEYCVSFSTVEKYLK